jgi:hypothetical protein
MKIKVIVKPNAKKNEELILGIGMSLLFHIWNTKAGEKGGKCKM